MAGSTLSSLLMGLCLIALPFSVACGGKSEVERGSSGAGGSAGGGSSSAGAATSAGGPSDECPTERPGQGVACNFTGSRCNYPVDNCSPIAFQCVGGLWSQVIQGDGASYDCNSFQAPNLPHDGDSCECFGKLDCYLSDCSGRGQLHAICDNTSWHVKESACPIPCGPQSSCGVGEVCVVHVGFTPTFTCAPDECARISKPLSCDCAGSLCSKSEQCSIDSGALACTCPTCR